MYRKYSAPKFKPDRSKMERVLRERIRPMERTEWVSFEEAAGRVCAADVTSLNTLPNRPVSRFDGIGVRYADFGKGRPETNKWQVEKDFVFANTGIAIPDGFDTVIPIEEVDVEEGVLAVHTLPSGKGENVGAVGGAMRAGELLIQQGSVISPGDVGLLASGGVEKIRVIARPQVSIIPTGDELVPPTGDLAQGKNIDSNSYMISAYLSSLGAVPKRCPIVRDEPDSLARAVEKAVAELDFVIVIAGSSLGTEDYTIDVLGSLGEVIVPEMAYGPGRKTSFSPVNGKPVLGIPGPPMGAETTCDTYLPLIINRLLGLPEVRLPTLEVVSDDSFTVHEVDFCERVHIFRTPDGCHMRSLFRHRTTRAEMMRLANGLFYRPAGTSLKPGEYAAVELLCPEAFLPGADQLPHVLTSQA